MRVYEFGSFEKPTYSAHVGRHIARADAPRDGNLDPAWCCKGHRTVRAAAQHAARLAVDEWTRAGR